MLRVISQYHSLSTNLPAKLAVELLFTTYLKKQNGFWSCEGKAHFGLFVNIVSCTYSSFFGRHWLSFKFCSRGSLRMKGWNMVAIKVVIPNLTHACMLFNQKTQCWVFMHFIFVLRSCHGWTGYGPQNGWMRALFGPRVATTVHRHIPRWQRRWLFAVHMFKLGNLWQR